MPRLPVRLPSSSRPLVAAQPSVLFVHGAANDHMVWALQSRYFAHHGWNVLAPDLPGHGRSAGAPPETAPPPPEPPHWVQ